MHSIIASGCRKMNGNKPVAAIDNKQLKNRVRNLSLPHLVTQYIPLEANIMIFKLQKWPNKNKKAGICTHYTWGISIISSCWWAPELVVGIGWPMFRCSKNPPVCWCNRCGCLGLKGRRIPLRGERAFTTWGLYISSRTEGATYVKPCNTQQTLTMCKKICVLLYSSFQFNFFTFHPKFSAAFQFKKRPKMILA